MGPAGDALGPLFGFADDEIARALIVDEDNAE
jgi:hypothetical protein